MKETPNWLKQELFQNIFEEKYGKHFQIKSFTVEKIEDPWDKTPIYRVQAFAEFKLKGSSSIFGCGSKKGEETISYLLRMSPEVEIGMYDKVIPAFEKLYLDKGKKVEFSPKPQKIYNDKVLLFEDFKSACLRKLRDFSEDELKSVINKVAQFHAASAVYAENHGLEDYLIKVEKNKEILDIFTRKVKPTIIGKCEHGEYFADKFFGDNVSDQYDPKEFNVLNHGQLWSNNILFSSSDEIYFSDYQLPKFGSPALDLYYLLLSATPVNDKTKKFDYLIKYYYDLLIENLKLLGYRKEIPYLTDLRMSLIRHGIWARIAVCGVVSISLATQNGDLFTNERYVKVLQDLLPWMDNRGLLEHRTPHPDTQTSSAEHLPRHEMEESKDSQESKGTENIKPSTKVPNWVKAEYFDELVKKEIGGFSRIIKFTPEDGAAGDKYSSVLLRINIEAELDGVENSTKPFSYILKTSHGNARDLEFLGLFERECEMYKSVLPLLERLYKEKNMKVKFGPKSYSLSNNPGVDHLVLEDLKTIHFKNVNRLEGLDTPHVESVLSLMAKLHAASAVAFETIKPYSECLTVGVFDKRNREMFVEFSKGMRGILKETILSDFENGEYYANKLIKNIYEHTDQFIEYFKVKPDQFNVLNHGDCWSNNIMFKYNNNNEIEEAMFVDFQISKYGSPVADLYNFLLSSVSIDIKLKKFDYFIKYYHDELVKNLEILGYPKEIPSLTDLHTMLVKGSVIARNVVIGVMGVALLDSSENANLDNFVNVDDAGLKFERMMFTNPRYKKSLSDILPWMDNKGLLE